MSLFYNNQIKRIFYFCQENAIQSFLYSTKQVFVLKIFVFPINPQASSVNLSPAPHTHSAKTLLVFDNVLFMYLSLSWQRDVLSYHCFSPRQSKISVMCSYAAERKINWIDSADMRLETRL